MKSLIKFAGPCTLNHVHLGWGLDASGAFNTAKESEYHVEMCSVFADEFAQILTDRGHKLFPENLDPDMKTSNPHKRRRAVAAKQPRGRQLPPVLPEYKEIVQMSFSQAKSNSAKILKVAVPVSIVSDRGSPDSHKEHQQPPLSEIHWVKVPPPDERENILPETQVLAGIYRTPEEYFEIAKDAVHPLDLDGAIPDELVRAVASVLENSPMEYSKSLLKFSRELVALVESNKNEDKRALEKLDPHLRKILAGKKLFTMSQLAEKTKHHDDSICRQIPEGFDLVGIAPFHNAFDYEVNLPEKAIKELRALSDINNQALLTRCKPTGDDEADEKLWKQCKEELDAVWLLKAFYNLEDTAHYLGSNPHLSRRFPLKQKDKVRAIDDLLESMVNSAWGSHEKLNLLDADSLAALVRLIEKVYKHGGAEIVLRSGEVITITLHKSWKACNSWRGRNVDLKAAYKQLGVSQRTQWASVICVFDTDSRRPCILPQATLPFGSASSVLHFNRAARLIWRIAVVEFSALWTNFYDDFPTLSPAPLTASVQAAISIYLKCIGWNYSDQPDKDLPFAESFCALGIKFNISEMPACKSSVENRKDRVEKVTKDILEILDDGKFMHYQAERLRGKVQFMEKSIFGRAGKTVARVFNRRGRSPKINDEDQYDLEWLSTWLTKAAPRSLTPEWNDSNLILFCDGACEYEREDKIVSCGAVLYDPRDNSIHYFGIIINEVLVREWSDEGKEQLVTEAELLPNLLARVLWGPRLKGAKLLNFIDSNPALFSCIKGISNSGNCSNIVRAIAQVEAELGLWPWYSRDPSSSNPSDLPSRLKDLPDTWAGIKTTKYVPEQPLSLIGGLWSKA